MAGWEAVEARSRRGIEERMVSSGRVQGCAVGRGQFNSGITPDDVQGAAFALWAGAAERRLPLFVQ